MTNTQDADLVFLATTNAPRCAIRIDKRLTGYATIQFMSAGGVDVVYDDRSYRLEGAWFWPSHPGPRIQFHAAPGHASWFHRHVGFQGPLVNRWMATGLWPDAPQAAPPGRDWSEFFDMLIQQAQRTDAWGRRRATNLLEQLLLELAEARTPSQTQDAWLTGVLEHLSREGTFTPDYPHLASESGMSLSTLRRRFKEATGCALHHHVLLSRMAAARSLLGETDVPIKAVAERLGYNNVYFFSEQFRQQIGVSPGLYRKSRQA